MNQSPDEARTARIQKYKEERRKQLTAKTATLFSANVTERRPRKATVRTQSDDIADNLKSSSDLNLSTPSNSVPIKTTRTSRLRAAAANHSNSSPSPRNCNRSSSVQSLLEDVKKTPKYSKIVDRDKQKSNSHRRSNEKENVKSSPGSCSSDKEIGAIKRKSKHSSKKNVLEKDKSNIVHSPKQKIVNNRSDIKLDRSNEDQDRLFNHNDEELFNDILTNNVSLSDTLEKQQIEDLFNDLVVNEDDDIQVNGIIEFNDSHKLNIPEKEAVEVNKVVNIVKLENSGVVPKIVKTDDIGGLLGSVCVRKVEKFSELLSNLCSPCEADILFEDILIENGIDGDGNLQSAPPECTPPCRRAQPSPRTTSTPVRETRTHPAHTAINPTGTVAKSKSRRHFESPHPKTENSLPSSRVSPKSAFNLSFGLKAYNKTSPPSTFIPTKQSERRRSSDTGSKPSCIPLSKKSNDKNVRTSTSPIKYESTKDLSPKGDAKLKQDLNKGRSIRGSPDKSNNSESNRNDKKQRAQKDSECASEKYHYSKKRLTSLENNSLKETNPVKNVLNTKTEFNKINGIREEIKDEKMLSTLHESARPHTSNSRLSQEMDSLAALTKQTLDRVNKLSNNLTNNKLTIDKPTQRLESLFGSASESKTSYRSINYGITNERPKQTRGVTERLKDIDTAAQRLIDFEKQSAMFSDLNNDTSSQNRRIDSPLTSCSHTPVSILKRKSIHEESPISNASNLSIASPPVTFSPSVIEPPSSRSENRQRQGILKKRRSLDESQVARRRSCSPEVSFADDGSIDTNKPILKNRRSSLEDVVRNRSPDGHIQGILKRKMSREEDLTNEDISHGSPEPQGILKRKSNSSSSSSTTSSHVSIAQAVLLAAAGGAEIVDEDKEIVRPILKKKSFSEERPCPEILLTDTPKPILKKKSTEHDDYDFDLPKKPILKSSKKLSGDEGHTSSFDMSEDDRSSRRPSLLRSRTSDHSGSECEAAVKPILKQRGSSLTRERSQSPRPRLSFCADNDASTSVTNISSDANDLSETGSRRPLSLAEESYPCAVLRRRNQRPKTNPRSKSLVCDVNDELLSILNNRRLKVEEHCENGNCDPSDLKNPTVTKSDDGKAKTFPSIAARIKTMEQALTKDVLKDKPTTSKFKSRDKERFKTQPITVEEMRSVTSSLEPGQACFQAFGIAGCSFPSGADGIGVAPTEGPLLKNSEKDTVVNFAEGTLNSFPYDTNFMNINSPIINGLGNCPSGTKDESYGEATFLDFENIAANVERKQSTLDEIEQEVNKVRVALDEDCRALDEDERQQAEADNWSLNVSCDSGVYNRASSRDSGPHSGEELGLIESQEICENQATNSSNNEWSSTSIEQGLLNMDRQRKSTEIEARSPQDLGSDEEAHDNSVGFALGLVKSNSVVARASMWQQLQQQAKGTPKPLIRHSRGKNKEGQSVADRFKTQPISFPVADTTTEAPKESFSLAQSKNSANMLDRDEDAKLDEDDPAKMSLSEKMKMFNSKLTHKPPVAGVLRVKDDRTSRAARLRTMPVLASQVQEAMEQNERLTKSLTHEEVPRNSDFQLKMELFRSASAKNTSLEYLMRQNAKFRSLDLDDESPSERAQRMITPEVRGILKSGSTVVPSKTKTLAKGESSEGLKDEGIDSSSDDESASASSVSSSEKSCSSSESSDEIPGPKPRRFQKKNNKLQSSRTDSDLTRLKDQYPRKIQLPGAIELKERLVQAKNPEFKPLLGKLGRKPSEEEKTEEDSSRYRRFVKKLDEPIQLGKLRRPPDTISPETKPIVPPPFLKISTLNQTAKNKFFGLEEPKKERTVDELTAAVRKYIPPVSKSMSLQGAEGGSGSDGDSSGGREVRRITARGRHRGGGGLQRSATHAEMPHRGGTIAERLAALQAAGANDWRARVCRLSPDREDSKAIERAKNRINDSLNAVVDEKKKVQIDENELSQNILADRRNKLETASQGWRKRVPQNDATLFTVAGRLERDKVPTSTPPLSPPPVAPPLTVAAPASPVVTLAATVTTPAMPTPNKFRSRKQQSPTNGFASGPLRSASCAVVGEPVPAPDRPERDSFKRSHSVNESIARLDEDEEVSPGAEKIGCPVRVPRADDETFQAFFAPLLQQKVTDVSGDVDLDAIDSASRQMLSSEWARRAPRVRRHAASRNPLKALAARQDLRQEYLPLQRENILQEKAVTVNRSGLTAETLAALASKEDYAKVALKSAANATPPSRGFKPLMLLHIKGRRRVQTRLVEPVHTNVNRGDCFILTTADLVYLYIGFYANVIERNRSTDIASFIHKTKDLGCKATSPVIKIDEQTKNYSKQDWNKFWTLLRVTEGVEDYKPVETGHADEDEIFESCIVQTNMCYEVMDDELVPIKNYWGQMPKIAMLHQSKIIVFDFGSELYIWYGKNVPLESRRKAAQLAQEMFDEGYNYEECHINPLNAAMYQGARESQLNGVVKTSEKRPQWAIISKVTQHMETILFKEKFLDWPDYSRVIQVKTPENKCNAIEINPCDAEEMWSNEYQEPDLILEGSHLGRGTNYYDKENMRNYDIKTRTVCKWVVHEYDFQKVENDAEVAEFFSGDSYIIRWEYQINTTGRELNGKPSKRNVTGRDRCAYFCWQGRDASSNEKGTAALLTVELDREEGPQVRVAQGNEPPAFLNLFQGNLIIYQRKRDTDKSRFKLFVIRGNVSNESYLLQVPCSVRQLRSRGSLILADTQTGNLYIWHGARSMKHTKNVAIELANKLIARKSSYLFDANASNISINEVKEGEEPNEVLEALGVANKQHYSSVLGALRDVGGDCTPRLFHFTDLSGQFEANEVLSPLRHQHLVTPFPFEQKELYSASQPALFLLDDGKVVWLWQGWWPPSEDGEFETAERNAAVGPFALRWQALRAAALRTSEAYCAAAGRVSTAGGGGDADGEEGEGGVRVVAAGLEPAAFVALFDSWQEHDEAADANIAHGYKAGEALSGARELSRLAGTAAHLPLAALQRRPLPPHVQPARLEAHLSDRDFAEAFGMTKEEFSVLPAWKQTSMKKEIGLF